MISVLRPRRRRSIGSLVAVASVAVATVTGVGLATDAGSVAGVDFGRLAGGDRYATAAEIATNTFGSATIALVVSGERFPDAVAASYLAGVSNAPVLLAQKDAVPGATFAALQSLGVDFVVVVGGTEALSAAVPAQLGAAGFPSARVAGGDRYQTASALSFVTGAPTVGLNESGLRTAILASGEAFPDALAAGPVAYDEHFPLLLTPPSGLHPATEQALTTLGIQHVVIVGGTGAVGQAVGDRLTTLGLTSERLQGGDRYATARAIAAKAISAYGHTADHVDIATGDGFPDALAGGPHAGFRHGVIVLTPTAPAVPTDTEACGFLVASAASVTSGHVLGGVQAVTGATEAALESCAAGNGGPGPGGLDPNLDYTSTPTNDTIATLGAEGASFTWTFTGVTDVVDVALVPCFAVTRGSVTTFADDAVPLDGAFPPGSQNQAVGRVGDYLGATYRTFRLGAAGAAQIVAANGAVFPTGYIDGLAAPAGGTLAVTVTATASDCAVPVVFADAGDDDELDLDLDERPTDRFGIGAAAVATLGEAPENQIITGEVAYLDEAANIVVLADGYRYDWGGTGDTYLYANTGITEAEFEIALSRLDRLGVASVPTPYHRSGANRFDIGVDVPGVATGVTAVAGDFDGVASDAAANDVTVTFSSPTPSDGLLVDAQVDIYRCSPTCVLVGSALDSDHEPASATPPANQDVNNDGLDDDVNRSVVVEDLSAGSYRFVVNPISFTTHRGIFGSRASAPIDSAAAPGSPQSTAAVYVDGGSVLGKLDPGDILRATFDEPMKAPDASDAVTVRSGTVTATLIHGTNATFFVTNDVLNIQVLQPVAAGQLPLAGLLATGSAGVTDPSGNEWDLAGSPDRIFG